MWAFILCLDLAFKLVAGFPTQAECRAGVLEATREVQDPTGGGDGKA